jgi:hypothetical protein
MSAGRVVVGLIAGAALALAAYAALRGTLLDPNDPRRFPDARVEAVSPLQVSNQTAYPLTVFGRALPDGVVLEVRRFGEAEVIARLPTERVDADRLGTRLDPGLPLDPRVVRQRLSVRAVTATGGNLPGEAELFVVNDAAFPTPLQLTLAADGETPLVVSESTDERWVGAGAGRFERTCDGPRDQARWTAPTGERFVITVCTWSSTLELTPDPSAAGTATAARSIATLGRPQALVVDDARDVAWVSSLVEDAVEAIDLVRGVRLRTVPVHVNPRALALSADGRGLWVSHMGSEDLVYVPLDDDPPRPVPIEVGPSATLVGGRVEPLAPFVMGDKPARALVESARHHVLLAATIGPNLGPNPARQEVSMNGGLTIVDAAERRFVRHVSMGRGVPQALALDDAGDVVYVADSATGRLIAYDVSRLVGPVEGARSATIAVHAAVIPADTSLLRPRGDFGVSGRAGVSLHAGPWSIALSPDRRTLVVLHRFLEVVERFDVSDVRRAGFVPRGRRTFARPEVQGTRRLGEVAYFTDLGHTGMTCDTCHPEGHDGGLLFTKGFPMQIHRSPNIRTAAHSAPYFTPALLPSLATMADHVLGRNRFENPHPAPAEVRALTEYTLALVPPPSPWRAAERRGAWPERVSLPDGATGEPRKGLGLFMGRAGCAEGRCHVPPHFTADQRAETRGALHDVGTPLQLPLRPAMQDHAPHGMPTPSLVGVWDNFPLTYSGAAGFGVVGERVVTNRPFALRAVLDDARASGEKHGRVAGLSPADVDDLLAFLLMH